ncbi:MAG: 4-alpha-glucanotransferase [Nitrospiraceae bacterium]|nr:4-alpha-glucanotransferase [Nitrospiraceae bacterium]
MEESVVHELARLMGIEPHYFDIWGNRHEVSIETKKALLEAMGLPVKSDEAMRLELEKRLLPPVLEPSVVALAGAGIDMTVFLPGCTAETSFRLVLVNEKKKAERFCIRLAPREAVETPRGKCGRYVLPLKPLREGYYNLSVVASCPGSKTEAHSFLIITPGPCFLPDGYDRAWGMTLGLHEIRSRRNWGIGDFRDLGDLVDWIAGLGGDFVGILPLHSIALPGRVSPYSPVSRLYRNFLFLDLEGAPEFAEAAGSIGREALEAEMFSHRRGKYVNYRGIHALKLRVLKEMFRIFHERHYLKRTARGRALEAFKKKEGGDILGYATFMALSDMYGLNWRDWPADFRDSGGAAALSFREKEPRKVLFHIYVQWLIEDQIGSLSRRAAERGMRAGLYFDLAVGVMSGGSDEWNFRDSLAVGVAAGAPPDEFSRGGQNWGFPPFLPSRMRENGFALFIKTIRKNLEHAGMLRIDHAMGLFRLFWIPEGMKPEQGAYVKYPTAELMGILEIESRRRKAVIIAEDLGTVESGVRETLMGGNMLSYRLFYYERLYPSAELVPPGLFPPRAFCAVSTHDLPTLCGYWAEKDIAIKRRLSLYPSEEAHRDDLSARRRDKAIIVNALKKEGLIPDNYEIPDRMNEELMFAIYRHLGRTPCLFVAASLEDWLQSEEQPNMPGTTDAYPNWRIKAPVHLESFAGDDNGFLAAAFRAEGRGRR